MDPCSINRHNHMREEKNLRPILNIWFHLVRNHKLYKFTTILSTIFFQGLKFHCWMFMPRIRTIGPIHLHVIFRVRSSVLQSRTISTKKGTDRKGVWARASSSISTAIATKERLYRQIDKRKSSDRISSKATVFWTKNNS